MAAVTVSECTFTEQSPNAGLKRIIVVSPATMDNSDTIAITLTDYGIAKTGLLYVRGWVHTTANSVIVAEAPTTSVTTGTLTITAGAVGGSDAIRVYEIVGKSN